MTGVAGNFLRSVASYRVRFERDDRGTVILVTAIMLPMLLLAMLGASTVMLALAKRQELQALAQAACSRAVKQLRMVALDDATRQKRAETMFDELAAERKFAISSRTVTAGWLESRVVAKATVPVVSGFGKQAAVPIGVDESCAGIPPYPALMDVILSSNFKTPSGSNIDLPYDGGKWGVFTAQAVGWDGGDGYGVELQDWSNGFKLGGDNGSTVSYLPPGVSNPFVVELDSGPLPGGPKGNIPFCGDRNGFGYNSSMYKNFELHPGTYRLGMWYRARQALNLDSTNKIVVYLEGTRPTSEKVAVITMNDGIFIWRYRSFDIPVSNYGLYRITVAAEGCSDGEGGLFNDLKLTYIQRPYPEYNDPLPPATN